MDDTSSRNVNLGSSRLCETCGYDLRGSESPRCPECGTPTTIAVDISDTEQFHRARAALDRAGLLVRSVDPGGMLGSSGVLAGRSNQPGWLWVSLPDVEKVERILDDLGIMTTLGARPIVDRAEPVCPHCAANLDPDGGEVCPHCQGLFHWVDIDQPEVDGTGMTCPQCDYDLTGCASDRCPECGAALPENLEAMVAAASTEPALRQSSPGTISHQSQRPRLTLAFVVECVVVMTVTLIAAFLMIQQNMVVTASTLTLGILMLLAYRLLRRL